MSARPFFAYEAICSLTTLRVAAESPRLVKIRASAFAVVTAAPATPPTTAPGIAKNPPDAAPAAPPTMPAYMREFIAISPMNGIAWRATLPIWYEVERVDSSSCWSM